MMVQKQGSYEYTFSYPSIKHAERRLHFSGKEILHLVVAVLLVVSVGLSLVGVQNLFYSDFPMLALLVAMFTVSFLGHEIAHKAVAQRYGLRAEFRLTLMGAALTLLSVVSPYIKIIGPGAVMVAGSVDRDTMGKTSIAGPTINIILATIFSAATLLPQYRGIFAIIAFYNSWIAIFNLIPLGILDGFKVFTWKKGIWTLAFATSVALGVLSYERLPM